MEITYREDTFPGIRRKILVRSFATVASGLLICGLYFFSIEWYFSLLPGILVLVYAFWEIYGLNSIETLRKNTRIVVSESGITFCDRGQKQPLYLSWSKIKMGKIKRKNGHVTSFGIRLYKSPIDTFEFSDDLTCFSEFFEIVNERTNV